MSDEVGIVKLMEVLLVVRYALWVAFVVAALMLIFCHLFPSMRGPNWTDNELVTALVFAVLAVALRP